MLASLPPLVNDAIGVNAHGTCYFTGVYGQIFMVYESAFVLGSTLAVGAVWRHRQKEKRQHDQIKSPLYLQITKVY